MRFRHLILHLQNPSKYTVLYFFTYPHIVSIVSYVKLSLFIFQKARMYRRSDPNDRLNSTNSSFSPSRQRETPSHVYQVNFL